MQNGEHTRGIQIITARRFLRLTTKCGSAIALNRIEQIMCVDKCPYMSETITDLAQHTLRT